MVVGIVLAIVIAAILAGAYYAFTVAFSMPKNREEDIYKLPRGLQFEKGKAEMRALIKEMAEIPYEAVTIKSYDGITLFGRYYHVADGAPVQIQFHGYKSMGVRDFCGGNKLAREKGHNTIIVDHRSHGNSQGNVITFGIKERHDCLSWAEYAKERFGEDVPVILAGISMGAATVLMATELDLPSNVKGVIADCPYSKPIDIIRLSSQQMELPGIIKALTEPFAILGARIFGKFNLLEANAVDAVKNAKVPILIIHGLDDKVVPHEMSEGIYNAAPQNIRRETFPEAGHGISYILDTPKYKRVSDEFIDYCIK